MIFHDTTFGMDFIILPRFNAAAIPSRPHHSLSMLRLSQSLPCLSAVLLANSATAQTADWDGGTGADTLWSTAANWLPDTAPAPGSILRFGTAAATLTATTNDTGGTFDSIEFTGTNGGFTITSATPGANALQLANGIRATHGGSPVSINSPLQLPGNQTLSLTGSGSLSIASPIALSAGDLTLHTASATGTPDLTLTGPISGNGGLRKTGSGLAILGGTPASTYTGTTIVNAGELRLTGNVLPANAITIGNGTTAAKLTTTTAEAIPDTADIQINDKGTLQLGGDETLRSLTFEQGLQNALNLASHTLRLHGDLTLRLHGDLTLRDSLRLETGKLEFSSGSHTIHLPFTGNGIDYLPDFGTTGDIIQTGYGSMTFNGTVKVNTYTIQGGSVLVFGDASECGPFILGLNGQITATGPINTIDASAGGLVQPLVPNPMRINTLRLGANAVYAPYSHVEVNTLFELSNATLSLNTFGSQMPGATILLVDNKTASPVTGRFRNTGGTVLQEGTMLGPYRITYSGGDGNDILLIVPGQLQPPVTFTLSMIPMGGGSGNPDGSSTYINWTFNKAAIGRQVELQASDDLGIADPWETLRSMEPSGSGWGTFTLTDTNPTGTRRFYRLLIR